MCAMCLQVDGSSKDMVYPNGTKKAVTADGSVVVYFFNGDIKRTSLDGSVVSGPV